MARKAQEATVEVVEQVEEQEFKRCACNCGTIINRKRTFAPGHDQRHKGALRRAFDAGSAEAEAELLDRGWNTQQQLDNRRAEAKAKAERAAEREAAKFAKAEAAKEAGEAVDA